MANTDPLGTLTLKSGENAIVEASSDGVTFFEVPFVGDIESSGSAAPETDIVSLRHQGKITGRLRVPTVRLAIVSYVPNHSSWATILAAARANTILHWKITTDEAVVFGASLTRKVAIATTGALTFSGTGGTPDIDELGLGMQMKIGTGTVIYSFNEITKTGSSDPVVSVLPKPGTAVVASASYKISNPGLVFGPFRGGIREAGSFTLAADSGVLASSLEIAPRAHVDWTAVKLT